MNNILIGVIGGTYWVDEVVASQTIREEKNFTESYQHRMEEINRVHKVKEVFELSAQEQHNKEQEYFRTEMMDDGKGEHSVVTVSSHRGFRQINLDGTTSEETDKVINPVKIQRAYFR